MFSGIAAILDKLIELATGIPGLLRDRKRKARLRHLLETGYRWRSIETLSQAIGATEEKTRDLLISIGARASTGQREVWGLVRRVDRGPADQDEAPGED